MRTNFRFLISMILIFAFIGCVPSPRVQSESQSMDYQLNNLVSQIITSLAQNQKTKIAVIEFSDIQGNQTNLGKFSAEELTTRLYLTGKFEVVERNLLNKVLDEHQFSLSGILDESSAVQLGKILGIDAIATGSITDLGSGVKVNARLISTESGKVFSVASVNLIKDAAIRNLLVQTAAPKPNKPAAQQAAQKPVTPQNPVMEKMGIKFEVTNAKKVGRQITVQVKLTNTMEDDFDFEMILGFDIKDYTTMMYDNNGNEYLLSAGKLGSNRRDFENSVTQYDGFSTKIIAGNSLMMDLCFNKVSSQTEKISLLQMNCGRKLGMIEFRGIDLNSVQ